MSLSNRLAALSLLASTAIAMLVVAVSCGGRSPQRPVILISVDTLRADALGIFGGTAVPTPHMDRLGREGAIFASTFAPVPRTTQAVATILSGLHPLTHGSDGLGMALAPEVPTLAEVLSERGFATAAFVTNVNLAPGLGYEQGFDLYSNPESRWKANSAPSLTAEAIAWLEGRDEDRPFFLWVHYLDPHWPYTPADEWRELADPGFVAPFSIDERQERREVTKGQVIYQADQIMEPRMIEHVRRLYFAEIAATDAAIGRLLAHLEKTGLLDESIVVFTADHGEALGEHRYWFAHGEYLYEDTLRVPWIIRAPGLVPAGTQVKGVSVLEDLTPTVLGLAGITVTEIFDGLDLASMLKGGGQPEIAPRTLVHLGDWRHIHPENPRHALQGREGRWTAVREAGRKLIRVPTGPGTFEEELYDYVADPRESANLAAAEPALVDGLRVRLEQAAAAYRPRADVAAEEPDSDTLDALRSLGYVN